MLGREVLVGLAIMLVAGAGAPAAAQWTNPYTGRSFNNPTSSLLDTFIMHSMQRKALERSFATKRSAQARAAEPTPSPTTPAPSPTSFRPAGQRLVVESFIEALGTTPEMKEGLRQVFAAVFQAFEQQASASGCANDVAAAIAFFIQAHYTVFHEGTEVGDTASDALLAQCREAFATPELVAAADGDRQKLYETFVMLAGLTAAGYEQAGDAERRHQFVVAGGEGLRSLLKVEPERVSITDTGLCIRPSEASSVASTGPVAWVEQRRDGATLFTDTDPATGRYCLVVVYDREPAAGELAASFAAEWARTVAGRFSTEGAAPAALLSRTSAGRRFLMGEANLQNGEDGTVWCRLHVLDVGKGKVRSVLSMSASKDMLAGYARDVRSLLDRTGERSGSPR